MSLSNVRSFVESFIRESEGTIGVVGLNNQMRVVILHTTVLNLLGNTSIHLRQIIDLYGNVRGEDSPWSGIVVSKRRQLMKSVVKRINNIKNMIARLCRRKG